MLGLPQSIARIPNYFYDEYDRPVNEQILVISFVRSLSDQFLCNTIIHLADEAGTNHGLPANTEGMTAFKHFWLGELRSRWLHCSSCRLEVYCGSL